ERVADGREGHVGAEQDPVAVRVDVAGPEQELPDDEEPPGGASPRPVHPDADDDRDHAREPEHVDQRPVPGERREEEVGQHQSARDGQIDGPHPVAPAHAATSAVPTGCSSKRSASLPSTSTSCSTSACVLTAVTWMRNPTSLL